MVTIIYLIISYFVFKFLFNYIYNQQKDIATKSNFPITFPESMCIIAMSLVIAIAWPITIPTLLLSRILMKWLESVQEKNNNIGISILDTIDKTLNGRKE